MSDFGFGKKKSGASEPAPKGKGMDLSGLPTGAVSLDPARERDAVQRGEALGFTDRGQSKGGRRKRPPPAPTVGCPSSSCSSPSHAGPRRPALRSGPEQRGGAPEDDCRTGGGRHNLHRRLIVSAHFRRCQSIRFDCVKS